MAKSKIAPVKGETVVLTKFEKELKTLEAKPFTNLLSQIESEFTIAEAFMKPKWDEWSTRLKLYNNQKRDKAAIGDPLLFTIHQTVLASLYDDKLQVSFAPREKGDTDTADNLTDLAEYDYEDMEKDQLDYYWDWDTSFFGRGLVLFMEFDRQSKLPIAVNIDPMTFLRDPRAVSVNGNRKGQNSLRFCGWETRMTKGEMKDAGVYFNLDNLGKADNNFNSVIDTNRALAQSARGYNNVDNLYTLKGENQEYKVTKWITTYQGKKVYVELANNRKTVVRYFVLPDNKIPIIDRAMNPVSNDWDGVSVPDLVEDKQRARAVTANLSLKGVKANLHPKYLFNSTKIKKTYLQKDEIGRHIPVEGDINNAIAPVQTSSIKAEVSWILDYLNQSAQIATATPEIASGAVGNEKRTATEIEKVSRGSDTRYSLSAKIWGWSEKRFWQQWYSLYKNNFASDIDEKVIRISGSLAARWRTLTRENIVSNIDPDVKIESFILAEAKRQVKLQQFNNFMGLAFTYPSANKLLAIRRSGQLNGLKKDDINMIIPPTIDELMAEDENTLLEKDKLAMVQATDDHLMHLEIHGKASETPAKYAHVQAHYKAMAVKKQQPDMFPPVPSEQMPDQGIMENMTTGITPGGNGGGMRGVGGGGMSANNQ